MNEENISFNEFAEAFDESADYQTDSIEEVAAEDDGTKAQEDAEKTSDEGIDVEKTSAENEDGESEKVAAGDAKPQQDQSDETFTLKVNKEEKTYSREEVINLAQKGADYDRVKEQLSQSRQENSDLQSKLSGQQEAMEVLTDLAKDAGTDISGLLKNLRIGLLKKQGLSEDAANERLLRLAAEKENASLKAAAEAEKPTETSKQRAQRELGEFREVYPDVELTQEILDKLMEDVQGGTSLLKAYQKYENAQKDAKIAELQRQLAAEKQNKENIASSPGSQTDSGGKRTKSDYDDFLEAFN